MVGITVEDMTALAGRPVVGITVTANGVVDVSRTVKGITWPVRTGRGVRVLGTDFIEDHEVPLGVEVTYTVRTWSEIASATITINSDRAWISDPLDWTSGIGLDMGELRDESMPLLSAGSLDEVKRGVSGSAVTPIGGRLPIRLGAARQAPTGVTAVITTWNQHQADTLGVLIEECPILLLRVPHDPQRAQTWGGHVAADVTATWAPGGAVDWVISGDVVAPPALPVVVVRHTYDAVSAVTGARTYQDVRNLQGLMTYTQVKRNPLARIGG